MSAVLATQEAEINEHGEIVPGNLPRKYPAQNKTKKGLVKRLKL
jgi:hypothetical protein